MKTTTATMSSKGQVVLPKKVRERLGVRQGDEIEFILDDSGVHVRPRLRDPNPFFAWVGAAPTGEGLPASWLAEVRHADLDDHDLALLRAGPGARVVRLALGTPHDPETADRP